MLSTKFCCNRLTRSREEDCFKVGFFCVFFFFVLFCFLFFCFSIYSPGGHLGHVTDHLYQLCFPV